MAKEAGSGRGIIMSKNSGGGGEEREVKWLSDDHDGTMYKKWKKYNVTCNCLLTAAIGMEVRKKKLMSE